MTTCAWNPNGQVIAQVDLLTVGGTAAGGNVVSGTINGKTISYTLTASDTNATAAAALQALLAVAGVTVPEFSEVTYAVSATNSSQIICTAAAPGTPFTLTSSATGTSTCVHTVSVPNSSPSDAANPNNWEVNGTTARLPQNGDDLVLSDSTVPVLWNLQALNGVMLNSLTRWQSMTGQIGLPESNPLGYPEYRPQYLQFAAVGGGSGSSGACKALLGAGQTGSGPPLEKYQTAAGVAWTVLAAGSPSGDYAARLLTGAGSTLNVMSASVGVAMLAGETASLASAVVDGGGALALGAGCTFAGTLAVKNGAVFLMCAPTRVTAEGGSQVTVNAAGLTYPAVEAYGGSSVVWASDSTLTSLVLQTGSAFDKSFDVRPITVVSSTVDADCTVLDPNNAIKFQNATVIRGAVQSGIFVFGNGRTCLWT